MPLILYTQLVFGNLFVIRTLQIFRARALLSANAVTKIGTLFVCASGCVTFFCFRVPALCFLLNFAALLSTLGILLLCERQQIDALKSEVPLFLDRWSLNLRLGSALPTARDMALREHSEGFQLLVRPLFATHPRGPTRRRHLLFSAAVLGELERLHHEPHAALARLENLRQLLRKTSEFRRKSGQAVQQTAIQSVVMVVLLFALTLFTLHRYGWRRSGDLIIAAQFLSALGIVVMYFLARKTKWKI